MSWKDRKILINGSDKLIAFPSDNINQELTELDKVDALKDFYLGVILNYRQGLNPLLMESEEDKVTLNKLTIKNNQDIVEMTYFMVHKKSGIFLIIKNRFAATAKTLEEYLNLLYSKDEYLKKLFGEKTTGFSITPLIEDAAMKKLSNLATMGKVYMNFEVDQEWEQPVLFGKRKTVENQLLDSIDNSFRGTLFQTVKIELTAKRKGTMSIDFLKNSISKLILGSERLKPKSLRATGRNQLGSIEKIDFLLDTFIFSQTFNVENKNDKYPKIEDVFNGMYLDFKKKLINLQNSILIR